MDKQIIDDLIGNDAHGDKVTCKLERMIVGAHCLHQTWGLGKIKRFNNATKKLVIDFENGKTDQEMDPLFCVKKLEILDENDLLVKFYNDPEGIRQQVKKSSINILVEYIESLPDKQASLGDVERTFADIVEKKNFKRWWNITKKLIARDPRLIIKEGNVTYIKLCENPISIEEQLISKFENSRSTEERLSIAEKIADMLADSVILKDAAQHIIDILSAHAVENFAKLSTGDKLRVCWIRNELAKIIDLPVDSLNPKIESVLHDCTNLSKVICELPYAYYSRFFELITRTFPDEWEKHCLNLMKNSNDKATNYCISYLCENGHEEAVKQQLIRWLHEKNLRTALLQWIIKNRRSKKSIVSSELMTSELFRAILWNIDNEFLVGTSKPHKIPLTELICEDKTLVHDLLFSASEEEVSDLAQMLLINQGFDSLSKKSLFARFIAIFPGIQNLISSASKAKQPPELTLRVTKESLEIKKKEYETLIKVKIPANKADISTARERGDLSENSEYKMARQDQETLMARKTQLENELQLAQIIDFDTVDTAVVSVGTVVTVRQTSGEELAKFAILGAWDSNPDKNIISYKTPIAQSLLSKVVGDTVDISTENNTKEQWKIENIERWIPES